MHTPHIIFLNRQKNTSFQTNLENESLAATEISEPGCFGDTGEVNRSPSGSLGEKMGEQNSAPQTRGPGERSG